MKINLPLPPTSYVADEYSIWYVDGHTSDNPEEWVLMTTHRDLVGIPSMSAATRAVDIQDWTFTPWKAVPNPRDLVNFKIMVGNIQRMIKGIQPVGGFLPYSGA